VEEIGMPLGIILGSAEPPPLEKDFVRAKWPFEIQNPMAKLELVQKLPKNVRISLLVHGGVS
jgi:hypothetical protein